MRTQPVNNAEKNNTNIVVAGVGGAAAAALATRYLPLTKTEHDEAFKTAAAEIAKKVREFKENQFKTVVEDISNNQELNSLRDVFVRNKENVINNAKEQLEQAAGELDTRSKNIFRALVDRITNDGKSAENILNGNVIKQAKKQRPILYFSALAAAASMTLAVLKNVITAKQVQDQTVGISYDKEGMIIDAPDSLSLAIILDEYA